MKKHEKEIIAIIKKHRIFSILDIFAFYKGCCRKTFYDRKLHELHTIKDALNDNRILTKQSLRSKWAKSDNATLQIALYKTICTNEERQHLNQSFVDHTSDGDKISTNIINLGSGIKPNEATD